MVHWVSWCPFNGTLGFFQVVAEVDDIISPLQGYKIVVTNLHPSVTQDDIIVSQNMSPVTRKPVFGFSDQVRHKPGCIITEDG